MAKNYNENEVPDVPEKQITPNEEWADFGKEKAKNLTEKEISADEKDIADELRREIDTMGLNEELKEEAKKKALKIEFLGEQEKIEHLLKAAREKGIAFAIKIAREMNDPYLLDVLHDVLAREGFYKKMGKTTDDDDDKN